MYDPPAMCQITCFGNKVIFWQIEIGYVKNRETVVKKTLKNERLGNLVILYLKPYFCFQVVLNCDEKYYSLYHL